MAEKFLIEKRGLYYCPERAGYTGLKRQAGRYSFEDAAEVVGPNGPDGPQDGLAMWKEEEAPEYSSKCAWDLKMKDAAEKPFRIATAVFEEMNANGFTSTPRVVMRDEFDLSKFSEQPSDFPEVETEWVCQSGPGMAGDDFYGTIAVPVDDRRLLLLDYST